MYQRSAYNSNSHNKNSNSSTNMSSGGHVSYTTNTSVVAAGNRHSSGNYHNVRRRLLPSATAAMPHNTSLGAAATSSMQSTRSHSGNTGLIALSQHNNTSNPTSKQLSLQSQAPPSSSSALLPSLLQASTGANSTRGQLQSLPPSGGAAGGEKESAQSGQAAAKAHRAHLAAHVLRVPANASHILRNTIEAQRRSLLACELRETDAEVELRVRQGRLAMLLAQQARREAWAAVDATHVQSTRAMLEEVVRAIRERQTALHPDGLQVFLFPNHDLYEGSWKNGFMHGKGCLRRELAKDLYEGQWFVGQRCGNGMYHGADFHFFYHGAWLDDKMHGKGELLEAEGSYVGEFHENHIQGYGEYVYHDGHVYRGEWAKGLYEGNGTYLYPSGARYEGRWQRGLEHGRGVRTFANGDVYNGEWRHGLMHGYGSYTSSLVHIEGNWSYGEVNGEATCAFADGRVYTGEWRAGRFDGAGTLICGPQGSVQYTGAFVHGRPHGRGVCTSNAVQYTGMWSNGKKEGAGVLCVHGLGGATYACQTWHADELHGEAVYCDAVGEEEEDNSNEAEGGDAKDDSGRGEKVELRVEEGVCTAIVEQRERRSVDLSLPQGD